MKKAPDPFSSKAAYFLALRWLTARELSEGQVRERLDRRGYTAQAIEPAVARLTAERVLDDRRAATAVARRRLPALRRGKAERVAARLRDYLLRRGYPASVVARVLRECVGVGDAESG